MTNYGMGFAGFKSAIEEVTDALGGKHTREAVAKLFSDSLTRVIQNRKGERFPSYSSLQWTEATDFDFDAASANTFAYLTCEREPVAASAEWKGVELQVRGHLVVLSNGTFSIIVAIVGERLEYDRKVNANVPKWNVHLTDDGKRLSNERGYLSTSRPSSTSAKSAAAGQKSLRRIVETFFNVKFKEVK